MLELSNALQDEADECEHLVVKSFEPPFGIEAELVVEILSEGMLAKTIRCAINGRGIKVQASVRGSRQYAEGYVDDEIKSAISCARLELSRPQ